MALLDPQADYQIRHANKEPEWSSICNNVFDQYLDTDDLFGLGASDHHGRSSSNDSNYLFDFSGSSEQSHQTEATSPFPVWHAHQQDVILEAQQPRPRQPVNFWTKTLKALEKNAAECENRQRKLRTVQSHPDFLSLGGHPSPPAIPSPTDQSFVEQRLPRSTANGKKRNITSRSLSRGRPTGVTKSAVAGSVNPHATLRKCSASPPKMMTPSRYRAGFKDIWLDKVRGSPKKYELHVPSSALPASPPPSARAPYEDGYAASRPNVSQSAFTAYDDFVSPLTNTFQQTHIHTPLASPRANFLAHAHNSYLEPLPPLPPSAYAQQTIPLNDTAPLFPERNSSLAPNRIQAFDFGFSSPPENVAWATADPYHNASAYSTTENPFNIMPNSILPTIEPTGTDFAGLGISCDPSLVLNQSFEPSAMTLPPLTYKPARSEPIPYYMAARPSDVPRTPHHLRSRSCLRSQSPSPPATEPRSNRQGSSARRASSRHRRTKSTNSTPRHPRAVDKSGFVNYTPDDSSRILNGVAPSGSSKTKLRREKEAADKRRRLSQAAIRAVVEAGGDVDALNKAGLFI